VEWKYHSLTNVFVVDTQSRIVPPQPSSSPMITPEQLLQLQMLSAKGQEEDDSGDEMDSDEEVPAPEALARYMAMRRHTIGVGDSEHEAPQDVRAKLAQHKPIIGNHIAFYT